MNDVVVRLVGGLGNQMFQYAAGKAVALRSGTDLVLDLSWFEAEHDRRYALAPLNISARTLDGSSPKGRIGRFLERATYRLTRRSSEIWQGRPVFRERRFHFDPEVIHLRAPVYLDGYFQSEKYFAEFQGVIAAEFRPICPPSSVTQEALESISACDAICVHVRRGDYVSKASAAKFHGVCPLDYYHDGVRVVAESLSRPRCFVFSDDPEWVRSNLRLALPMSVIDVHGLHEAHEDLRLMAACKHFVIANSSLSWWGAWLGTDPGKRVVSPIKWFQSSANDTKDLIPERWVRI